MTTTQERETHRIIRAADRFHTEIGWLNSWHTFAFGDHYDPNQMGFRILRVINDDVVGAGQGFGMHPHRDMEIITYMLRGELAHKDSQGNASTIKPGMIQRMSAGSGLLHSEFNPSPTNDAHLLQIWLFPQDKGIEPSYEESTFDLESAKSGWLLLAAPRDEGGRVLINTDARVYTGLPTAGAKWTLEIGEDRHAWAHIARGSATINGERLLTGDGIGISGASAILVEAHEDSEIILFDLP